MATKEIPSSEMSTLTSRTKRSSKRQDDVAATRHLRLMINSIAENKELSAEERKERICGFERMLEDAERRLHFTNGDGREGPDLTMEAGKDVKRRMNAISPKGGGKKESKKSSSFLGRFRRKKKLDDEIDGQESARREPSQAESLLESVAEDRQDEQQEINKRSEPVHQQEEIRQVPEQQQPSNIFIPTTSTTPQTNSNFDTNQDEEDNRSRTSSIIDVRIANSEDYTASICSIRSLGTFERDFINNIMEEQVAMEEISVSTFEQDAGLRRGGAPLPVEIGLRLMQPQDGDEDDLTLEPVLSETTFERDARKAAEAEASFQPPAQVQFSNDEAVFMQDSEENDDDDLSETTFEQDQRRAAEQRQGLASPANASDEGSVRSVSTFEKDAAARMALAVKIGRIPSTGPSKLVVKEVASEGTFEKDARLRANMSQRSRRSRVSVSSAPSGRALSKMPSAPAETIRPTESETVYEREARQKENNARASQQMMTIYTRQKDDDDKSRFEKDVSRNMSSKPVKLVVMPARPPPPVPRINDLVLELSPEAIKKQERQLARKRSGGVVGGGVMSRFLCHCGLGERNVKLSLETS